MWNGLRERCKVLWIRMQCFLYAVPERSKMEKKSGGKEVIVEFVLMVVAVAVGYIFRDQIKNLITSLGTNVSEKIAAMFS